MESVTITEITPPELESLIEKCLKRVISHQVTKPEKEEEYFLTVKEAADFLRLTPSTIYLLRKKGQIPSMRRSKRRYFLKSDLINYLKSGKNICNG